MKERMLISGSSVARPTLAFWLAKYGFRPTAVERAWIAGQPVRSDAAR
jgi:hypothetical protein